LDKGVVAGFAGTKGHWIGLKNDTHPSSYVQEGKVGPDLEKVIHIKPGITDTTPFPLSKTISAAHVVIKPLGVGERP